MNETDLPFAVVVATEETPCDSRRGAPYARDCTGPVAPGDRHLQLLPLGGNLCLHCGAAFFGLHPPDPEQRRAEERIAR